MVKPLGFFSKEHFEQRVVMIFFKVLWSVRIPVCIPATVSSRSGTARSRQRALTSQDFWPSRILVCIPTTVSSLVFSGTGCTSSWYQLLVLLVQRHDSMSHDVVLISHDVVLMSHDVVWAVHESRENWWVCDVVYAVRASSMYQHCNTLQHTATHCNTLQHTATHCNTLQHTQFMSLICISTATHCNTRSSWV